MAVITRIIKRCLECGARVAQPGEFSRRAFLNGKIDLAQAEALTDLISSQSEAARRLALRQLRGGLSRRLQDFNSNLLDAAAEIEAHIDFPDEDIPDMARDRILGRLDTALAGMEQLLAGHEKARVKSEGARVILAGEANAGKSSLFNALVGRERAIVSPHPGTTRDTIEAVVEIGGLAITLVDTAGIREGAGEIEQIGIDRTHEEIREADLVLHLLDGTSISGAAWPALESVPASKLIRILTKKDHVSGDFEASPKYIQVSSATGTGLNRLEALLCEKLIGRDEDDPDAEMSRVRHAEHLRRAIDSTRMAKMAFEVGESGDLVMVDLRDALSSIGEILGERLDEQILDRIFSTFCLGK
jgi:tRNA modification GTPase